MEAIQTIIDGLEEREADLKKQLAAIEIEIGHANDHLVNASICEICGWNDVEPHAIDICYCDHCGAVAVWDTEKVQWFDQEEGQEDVRYFSLGGSQFLEIQQIWFNEVFLERLARNFAQDAKMASVKEGDFSKWRGVSAKDIARMEEMGLGQAEVEFVQQFSDETYAEMK